MNDAVVYTALVLLGACLGSFAGAMVWRLRARQLKHDKEHHEKVDSKEYARLRKLTEGSVLKDRSQCLHCSYTLRWYDLIPIVSWLSLRGKCRSCHHPIGSFELLIEIGLASFFALSYAFWPLPLESAFDMLHFFLWLTAGVLMAILFAYDAKWFLLPDKISYALAGVGGAIVIVSAITTRDPIATLLSAVGSVAILSGLYLVLYLVSKQRWVGFGDVKLGLGLGLILIDWQLALIALFLANLIGALLVTPLLISKKLKRSSHIPFGPLMIIGAVLAWFIGWPLFNWYTALLGV